MAFKEMQSAGVMSHPQLLQSSIMTSPSRAAPQVSLPSASSTAASYGILQMADMSLGDSRVSKRAAYDPELESFGQIYSADVLTPAQADLLVRVLAQHAVSSPYLLSKISLMQLQITQTSGSDLRELEEGEVLEEDMDSNF
jgi:hypothetical protein